MPRKMLMIDGDGTLIGLVGKYARLKGWGFEGVRQPEEALERARRFKPDVIGPRISIPPMD